MKTDTFVAVFRWHKKGIQQDYEIPLDISANELIVALDSALNLGLDLSDLSRCYLKTENPIALLRGNKLLRDYRLRDGTIINYTL